MQKTYAPLLSSMNVEHSGRGDSLGGCELLVDKWGIDAVYSGSQKCLSCIPGLSPISFSPAAVEKLKVAAHQYKAGFWIKRW